MTPEDKEEILEEIRAAFAGVTWEGGKPWVDAQLDDSCTYPSEEQEIAHEREKGRDWLDVARDPEWRIDLGWNVAMFLDPIGYRYYLPAMMTKVVLGDDDGESVSYSLTVPAPDNEYGDHTLNHWSLFTPRQLLCVRHFLEYMFRLVAEQEDEEWAEWFWGKPLKSCWKNIAEAP